MAHKVAKKAAGVQQPAKPTPKPKAKRRGAVNVTTPASNVEDVVDVNNTHLEVPTETATTSPKLSDRWHLGSLSGKGNNGVGGGKPAHMHQRRVSRALRQKIDAPASSHNIVAAMAKLHKLDPSKNTIGDVLAANMLVHAMDGDVQPGYIKEVLERVEGKVPSPEQDEVSRFAVEEEQLRVREQILDLLGDKAGAVLKATGLDDATLGTVVEDPYEEQRKEDSKRDALKFYQGIAKDAKVPIELRMRAQTRLDKIIGHEPNGLNGESPQELAAQIQAFSVEAGDIFDLDPKEAEAG